MRELLETVPKNESFDEGRDLWTRIAPLQLHGTRSGVV
jgi:hypothetical protein